MDVRFFSKGISFSFLSILLVFLVACSDSRDNRKPSEDITASPAPTQTASPSLQTVVSGRVVKGSVGNADVHFYRVDNNTIVRPSFAQTQTDAAGKFSVEIQQEALSELVYVEVMAAADGSTSMVCDAEFCGSTATIEGIDTDGDGRIGFGESVNLSPDFILSAVFTHHENSREISVNVTPISHVALQRAVQSGDLSQQNVLALMAQISALFDLPSSILQLPIIDISDSNPDTVPPDSAAVTYGVLSAMFAAYANENNLTIEAAIEFMVDNLYREDGNFNREAVLALLDGALHSARSAARNDQSLQQVISAMQLLISRYRCEQGLASGEQCEDIDPEPPVDTGATGLATVKSFVAEFRSFVRDFSLNSAPVLNEVKGRSQLVGALWEDDFRELASALNDLLPGIAQTISPRWDFCYYCENDGFPTYTGNSKQLRYNGLTYTLNPDGTMAIVGLMRDIEVDMDLLIPSINTWQETQTIEILAARLSRDNTDLLLTDGSHIRAVYEDDVSFESIGYDINSRYGRQYDPQELSVQANFVLQSTHSVSQESSISFESGERDSGVSFTGGWTVDTSRASAGSRSLRSQRIGHNQRTETSIQFNTSGGTLSFDYALESEEGYDFFSVYLDGRRVLRTSGYASAFRSTQIFVAPGEHTLTFLYSKDGSVVVGSDAAWIDNVRLPPLVNAGSVADLEARSMMTGEISLIFNRMDRVWYGSNNHYLPADIQVQAHLTTDYTQASTGGEQTEGTDQMTFGFAANIANAADFIPPRPLDPQTLVAIGEYRVSEDLFELELPGGRAEITRKYPDNVIYEMSYFEQDQQEASMSQSFYSEHEEIHKAAVEVLSNSLIGTQIIVPEQGLYILTLLGASPYSVYHESQFSPEGGTVYGILLQPFNPEETLAQYLEIAVAAELSFNFEGLTPITVQTQLNRSSLNSGELALSILYEGHRFNFETDLWYSPANFIDEANLTASQPNLIVSNGAGVQLRLTANADLDELKEGDLEGALIYNGSVFATVERIKGITLIRYIDGSSESLE